jgi:hypothetical protein
LTVPQLIALLNHADPSLVSCSSQGRKWVPKLLLKELREERPKRNRQHTKKLNPEKNHLDAHAFSIKGTAFNIFIFLLLQQCAASLFVWELRSSK